MFNGAQLGSRHQRISQHVLVVSYAQGLKAAFVRVVGGGALLSSLVWLTRADVERTIEMSNKPMSAEQTERLMQKLRH